MEPGARATDEEYVEYRSSDDEFDHGSPYFVDATHKVKLGISGRGPATVEEPQPSRSDKPVEVQCNSEMSTKITISPVKLPVDKYTYRVKVVNPERKSEFIMDKLSDTHRFKSIAELRYSLMDHLKFQVETLGYIEPGHGLRGKQQWLNREGDLDDMYECTKHRKEVTLWCYRLNESLKPSRKRTYSESTDPPAKAKRETCARSTDEVEDIICSLKQRHDKKFSMEQMSCWAHLYRMGKHSSLDDPPNLPFFTGYKRKTVHSATQIGPTALEKSSLSSSSAALPSIFPIVHGSSDQGGFIVVWASLLYEVLVHPP